MNQQLKGLQEFLKTGPLGVSYSGDITGKLNPQTTAAALALQNIIKQKLSTHPDDIIKNKAKELTILSGPNVTTSLGDIGWLIAETVRATPSVKKEDKEKSIEKPNPQIESVQKLFNSNPFGLSYNGPKDGKMNPDFVAKLRQLESAIQSISGVSVLGKIVAGNNLVTNTEDLMKTFKIIKDFQEFLAKSKSSKSSK